jgi:hypothetical protein
MAGLAWSAPVSCVALSDEWERAPRSAPAHTGCGGAYSTRIRTQLLECYCACRRHQGCHCRETETSVRLRFLGSTRTSRCLPVCGHMGCGAQSAMAGRKLNAEHLLGVAQLASWRGDSRRKRFEFNRAALAISAEEAPGSSRGRADVSTADLANCCDRPHMRRGSTNQCNPRRRQGGDPLCSRLP